MLDVKFFPKYYTGLQKGRYQSTDEQRLLGFATPMEDNAAGRKRIETVDGWRDSSVEPIIFDNTPTFGFEIADVVRRYETSNKLYRIVDPRGFELEISAENLFSVIMTTTIVCGKIMEPMVWGRLNGANYLISGNSQEYKRYVSPKKETPALAPGQYFVHPASPNLLYRYEGKFHAVSISAETHTYDPANRRSWYGDQYKPKHPKQVGHLSTWLRYDVNTESKTPYMIYTEFRLNDKGEINAAKVHLRKGPLKDLDYIGETHDSPFVNQFKLPVDSDVDLLSFKHSYGASKIDGLYGSYYDSVVDFTTSSYNLIRFQRGSLFLYSSKNGPKEFSATIEHCDKVLDPLTSYSNTYSAMPQKDLIQDNSKLGKIFIELFVNGKLTEAQDL